MPEGQLYVELYDIAFDRNYQVLVSEAMVTDQIKSLHRWSVEPLHGLELAPRDMDARHKIWSEEIQRKSG